MLRLRPRPIIKPVSTPESVGANENSGGAISTVRAPKKNLVQSVASNFETPYIGLYECAPEGRFTVVNTAFAQIFGCETVQKFIEDVLLPHDLAVDGDNEGEYLRQLAAIKGNRRHFKMRIAALIKTMKAILGWKKTLAPCATPAEYSCMSQAACRIFFVRALAPLRF